MGINSVVGQSNVNAPTEISATKPSTDVQQVGNPNTGVAGLANQAANPSMSSKVGNHDHEVAAQGAVAQGAAPMTPEQMAAQLRSPQERISSAIATCKTIVRNPDTSPEARVVYERMSLILEETLAACNGDFSSASIEKALAFALKYKMDLPNGGTVEMYNMFVDDKGGKSITGKRSTWGDDASSIRVCENLGINEEGVKIENYPNMYSKNWVLVGGDRQVEKHLYKDITSDNGSVEEGRTIEFRGGETRGGFTIRCDSGIDFDERRKQLNSDADTFSGDIHIHRLEPGTVLVRVFGQGQSPLRACWCRADDPTSSVTCAKDLLGKLAVRPDWNGDGNMAVMIVPNDVDVVVAEGKIGAQICTYKTGGGGRGVVQEKSFTFPGGGTQLNVLAKDQPNGYPPFAGDSAGVLKRNCMFTFKNTGVACVRDHLPQEQQQ